MEPTAPDSPPRKPFRWALVVLFLLTVYVVVEVVSLQLLGTNASQTFTTAPAAREHP